MSHDEDALGAPNTQPAHGPSAWLALAAGSAQALRQLAGLFLVAGALYALRGCLLAGVDPRTRPVTAVLLALGITIYVLSCRGDRSR